MGHYAGHHIAFVLKPDTPKDIVEFFNQLYLPEAATVSDLFNISLPECLKGVLSEMDVGDIISQIWSQSVYQEAYNLRRTIPEVNGYESFASSKCYDAEALMKMFAVIFPYLVVKDGDILVRTTYEEATMDAVVWVDVSGEHLVTAHGFAYDTDHGYCNDSRSPNNAEEGDDIFVPLMNWHDLKNQGMLRNLECEYYKIESVRTPGWNISYA